MILPYLLLILPLFISTTIILKHSNKLIKHMNTKQAIRKIKIMLGAEAFMQKTLIDGTRVEAEDFVPGAQLSVVTEDGLIPAPEGEHTTDDGVKVVVDSAGVILEVSEVPTVVLEDTDEDEKEKMEDEDKEDEEMADKDKKKKKMADKDKEKMDQSVDNIIEALAPVIEQIVEMKKELEDFKKKFAKFASEPAAQPISNNFNSTQSTLDKKIAILNQIRKTNKNK